jgi:hypothetical protein
MTRTASSAIGYGLSFVRGSLGAWSTGMNGYADGSRVMTYGQTEWRLPTVCLTTRHGYAM